MNLGSLITTTSAVGGIAAVALGALYYYQDGLLYFPNMPPDARTNLLQPERCGILHHENVYVTAKDGVKIHCWMLYPDSPDRCKKLPTVVYFHGNAGNMSYFLPSVSGIVRGLNVKAFLVSYRGYGLSEGSPNEAGLKLDGKAVLDHLLTRSDVDHQKIVLYGLSLGGAVVIHLASTRPQHIRCAIVENTFTSIPEMIDVVMPCLTLAKPLCTNPWESLEAIKKVKIPMLFVSGQRDELVPKEMMEKLHDSCVKSPHKELLKIPAGRHNDTWSKNGYDEGMRNWFSQMFPH